MNDPTIIPPGQQDEVGEEVAYGGSALSKLEEADRAHMIATARKYPRSITKFVQDLTELSCYSAETAMEMIYSLPRAGKQLTGPSVRFAEAALACWGNCRAGMEVVDVDRREGVVTAEGRFYDCEKNYGFALRKRRRIVAKQINADAIQVTGDAINSIAFRDAVLRGIPKALWSPVWNKAKSTAVGDAKSIAVIRQGQMEAFNKLGVTEVQVLNALGVPGMADIGPDQILAMQAWRKQLNDGESAIEDIFGSPEDELIEKLMTQLGWNDSKKRMSRETHKGNRSGHLEYVQEQVAKAEKLGATTKTAEDAPGATGKGRKAGKATPEATASSEPAKTETAEAKTEQSEPATDPAATAGDLW